MANDNPSITIPINKNIEKALKEGYEDYLAKAEEEDVLTAEEYNLHILKLGILSNEIRKKEIELQYKEREASNVKSEVALLKKEFRTNRIKIKTAFSFE